MKDTRYPFRRNAAIITAAGIIGALGIGGVLSARASPTHTPTSNVQKEASDGDGETNDDGGSAATSEKSDGDGETADDATETPSDGESNDDATDQGPDANPDEPGHQDAGDAGSGTE